MPEANVFFSVFFLCPRRIDLHGIGVIYLMPEIQQKVLTIQLLHKETTMHHYKTIGLLDVTELYTYMFYIKVTLLDVINYF